MTSHRDTARTARSAASQVTRAPTWPYTADDSRPALDHEELRARIPGWGADLDPADRPSDPMEQLGVRDVDGVDPHWTFPDRQPEHRPRERSIEHGMLTPVFGTAQPLGGLSGTVRRLAYRRFSEGRAAHWLLLVVADRVDVVEHVARSWATGKPENPLVETGLRSEAAYHGLAARRSSSRSDDRHHAVDPLVVAGPWLVGGWLAWRAARALTAPSHRKD